MVPYHDTASVLMRGCQVALLLWLVFFLEEVRSDLVAIIHGLVK